MQKELKITVDGRTYNVTVVDVTEDAGSHLYPTPTAAMGAAPAPRPAAPAPVPAAPAAPKPAAAAGGANDRTAPLGGVVVEILASVGQTVNQGDKVAVIEAMKMKTVVTAHKSGTVSAVAVKVGDTVDAGQPLMTIS